VAHVRNDLHHFEVLRWAGSKPRCNILKPQSLSKAKKDQPTLRDFLAELDGAGHLLHVKKKVSAVHEIAAVASRLDGRPVIFEKVRESEGYRVALGVCATRGALAKGVGVSEDLLLAKVLESIEDPKPFRIVGSAPCQEVVEDTVDLRRIPVLTHCEKDGGPYVTAGIVVARDKEYGYNASYHRLMLIGRDRLVARILPRHLDEFIRRGVRDVGISVGNHPAFLFAAAVSCEIGKSELAIANRLKETDFVKCGVSDSVVPAECELVLEGEVTDEYVDEGPFPDIIGAYDIVRKQRVIRIKRVTHRRNPIYQAIIPGGVEHRFLMGTPREATMFREVNKVCRCIDARLTAGGSSWLHGALRIRKEKQEDGKVALEAAFRGHPSLKHAVVVDEDIDIGDPEALEWAVATRAQLDRDLVLKPGELGSSLDPSADQVTRVTCKAGLDATLPLGASREPFVKARIPMAENVRMEDYLV
jgi:UbiD family decarboxylase